MSDNAAKTDCPLRFDIGGMHCAACSSRIERVLNRMPGIKNANVNLATARAEVWPEGGQDAALQRDIMERVARLGFTATPAKDGDSARQYAEKKAKTARERQIRLKRLWPMVCLTAPLLLISMGHMAGMPLPAWLEPHQSPRAFILVQLLLTLPVVWWGRHFYVEGLAALWRRAPNMDSLVAIGTGAAFLYSLVNAILGFAGNEPVTRAMNLYFESCAVLLCMIEFGQFLEFTARSKAGDAIGALMSLAPDTALLLREGDSSPVEIPAADVKPGDRLVVRPGSRIPVDGIVAEGASAVDLSLLTGESMPVPVTCGDSLAAGSVNGEGALVMEATSARGDTKLARIIRMVEEAQGSKAPIARLADRVSYYFVPAVMIFALLSSVAWLVFSPEPLATALTVFVAVLVMACPCAMGLATPMSIMVGTGRGAQMGILIKNGAALEQAGRVTALCLDKTGTLTTGKPALAGITMINSPEVESKGFTEMDILALAASLEGRSEHPLALAIINAAGKENLPGCPVTDIQISPGLGIAGTVEYKDIKWRVMIGNENFLAASGNVCDGKLRGLVDNMANAGQTPLLFALGEDEKCPSIAALLGLADQLRPESPAVVEQLRRMGLKLVMLTGDNALAAKAIAAKAGITEVHAELLPAQKADFVRQLREQGYVVGMVGDGINDAPALALADAGFAVGTGVDVSAEAGDVVLMRGGMKGILSALGLSRAAVRNIRQNLGWAFGYNILGLPVAAGILHVFGGPMLSPMIAGGAMALSSFSVVANALRLRWFGRK